MCLPDDAPDTSETPLADGYDDQELPLPAGCTDDNLEPNDVATQASPLQAGVQQLQSCGDDWFTMMVPAGQTLVATLDFQHAQSDLDLYAYAGEDKDLPVQASEWTLDSERVHPGPFPQDTMVTLRIRNAGGQPVEYTLTTELVAMPANNACANAVVLSPGQTVDGSTLGASSDVTFNTRDCTGFHDQGKDVFYQVSVPAGGTLTATLQADDDLALYLVDGCATRCCWGGADQGDWGMDETLHYQNATGAPQVLFLGVDGWSAANAGQFSLSVQME